MPFPFQILNDRKSTTIDHSSQPTTRQLYNQQKYENLIRGSKFVDFNPQKDIQEEEFKTQ